MYLLSQKRDFTFVCPTEIIAFNDALPKFKELGVNVLGALSRLLVLAISEQIIGVSTDSQYSHLAWANQSRKQGGIGPNLKLPLVADKTCAISRDYGVLIEEEGIALRGLFIIDSKGIIRWDERRFEAISLLVASGAKHDMPSEEDFLTACEK